MRAQILACILLVGCGGSGTGDGDGDGGAELDGSVLDADISRDPPPTGLPMSEFCGALGEASCEGLQDCNCGPVDLDNCKTTVWLFCPLHGTGLQDAIAAGLVVYDGEAAASYLTGLQERNAGCQQVPDPPDWPLRGTLQPGEVCEPLSFLDLAGACEDGACFREDDDARCRRGVGLGEACGPNALCIADINDLLRLAFATEQSPSLRCETEGEAAGTCVPAWLPDGAACGDWHECESRRCVEAICTGAAPAGDGCEESLDCGPEGWCVDATCEAKRMEGEPCTDGAQCLSTSCGDGLCRPPICRYVASSTSG